MAEIERELTNEQKLIEARPSKNFFVWMLTRDIGVTECILDLIDNPVDNVVEGHDIDVTEILLGKRPKHAPKSAAISIEIASDSFSINDTCGGISVEDARELVFRFGYPADDRSKRDEPGLSVYGVGMKRAFFKLGRLVEMRSTTKDESFDVEFDVDDWVKDDSDWHLEFARVADITKAGGGLFPGTDIAIKRLTKIAGRRFSDPKFVDDLRGRIGTSHGLFIKAGIRITVNGEPAESRIPMIVKTEKLGFVRQTFNYKGVEVIIIVGLTPKEDRVPHGWYIFCNGRMVVEADKTSLTGWGDDFPQFHTKYNHFCGFVYFRSRDVNALPWTTTKQGIERESEVFLAALDKMQIFARPVLDYLNDLYPGDVEDTVEAQRDYLRNAPTVGLDKLPVTNQTFSVKSPKSTDPFVSIQYKRPKSKVDKVRRLLGDAKLPAYRVGEETFDYFLEHQPK